MNILKVLTRRREIGNRGELAAAKYIKRRGFKIREKNYVALGAEVDIIAENKEYLLFIEVKTRTAGKTNPKEPRPASAVTPEKQRTIIKVAQYYIAYYKQKKKIRLDIIEVLVDENMRPISINHMENAFTRDSYPLSRRKETK